MQTHTDYRDGVDPRQRNQESLVRVGLMTALAVFFAALMPPVQMAAMATSLLQIGAFVSIVMAARQGERLGAPHLTRWDEAAALMLASMLAGTFVDPDAVAAAGAGAAGGG